MSESKAVIGMQHLSTQGSDTSRLLTRATESSPHVAQDGVTGRSEGGSASCRGGEVAFKETHAAHELKNGSSGAAARPLLGAQATLTYALEPVQQEASQILSDV